MMTYMMLMETPQERSKFEKIYIEYKNLMFYIAKQILQNEHDAEDAVHQAFVSIAENIEKIDEPVCPKTKGYVVIIAEHKALDMYRMRMRHKSVEYLDEIMGITYADQQRLDLANCILKLPANYRNVMLLKHQYGFSNKEIAKQLGLSEPNVIKLDQRGKKKLLQICREEGIVL